MADPSVDQSSPEERARRLEKATPAIQLGLLLGAIYLIMEIGNWRREKCEAQESKMSRLESELRWARARDDDGARGREKEAKR